MMRAVCAIHMNIVDFRAQLVSQMLLVGNTWLATLYGKRSWAGRPARLETTEDAKYVEGGDGYGVYDHHNGKWIGGEFFHAAMLSRFHINLCGNAGRLLNFSYLKETSSHRSFDRYIFVISSCDRILAARSEHYKITIFKDVSQVARVPGSKRPQTHTYDCLVEKLGRCRYRRMSCSRAQLKQLCHRTNGY